jgi:DNA ligase-1
MASQLCPDYMGVELGIGESLIVKAIAQSTGRSVPQIKADMIKVGDLGEVAQVSFAMARHQGTRSSRSFRVAI